MSAVARPTSTQMTRRLIVLAAAVFAVVVAQAQMLLGWGQTAAEFAADSDATLKVAGFAFAIWGVIYLGLLVYAVRQVLPGTPESDLLGRMAWPSVLALLGIGWWIVAAAFDWETGTIGLIFGSLLVLLAPLLLNAGRIRRMSRKDAEFWTVAWPLALLAGWLSIAAPVNLITVATGNGDLPTLLSPNGWAMLAVVIVAGFALVVTQRLRMLAFALPVVWGLLGVFVAELARNAALASVALAASVAVLAGSVLMVLRWRRGVERPL